MFHFLPVAIRYDGSSPTKGHGYQVHIGPMYADTRGYVRIKSDRPQGPPVDAFQLPVDRRPTGASGSRRSGWPATSSTSPRSRRTTTASSRPGRAVETDEQILEWVRADAETALHPSCTAAMGVEEMSVVDPATMKVHGLEGLRVVDASVFPFVTNGNIYAPVMMVAEKAADLIAGNTPLAPADVPWYRHGVAAPSTRPATRATTRRCARPRSPHDRHHRPEPATRVPPAATPR